MNQKEEFMRRVLSGTNPSRGGGAGLGLPRKAVHVPVVSPFHDWQHYYLRQPITWLPEPAYGDDFKAVTVPAGFVTDFASVPRPFWSILPPAETYTHAAIVHDYLYWKQLPTYSRDKTDKVLRIGMVELGVDTWKVFVIFRSVRLFGGLAWKNNTQQRAKGEKRILKKFPDNPLETWENWKSKPDVFVDD